MDLSLSSPSSATRVIHELEAAETQLRKAAAQQDLQVGHVKNFLNFLINLQDLSSSATQQGNFELARIVSARTELLARNSIFSEKRHGTDEDWMILALRPQSQFSVRQLREMDQQRQAIHHQSLQSIAFVCSRLGLYEDARQALIESVSHSQEVKPQTLLNLLGILINLKEQKHQEEMRQHFVAVGDGGPGRGLPGPEEEAIHQEIIAVTVEAIGCLEKDLAMLRHPSLSQVLSTGSISERSEYQKNRLFVSSMLVTAWANQLRCLFEGYQSTNYFERIYPAQRAILMNYLVLKYQHAITVASQELPNQHEVQLKVQSELIEFSEWLAASPYGSEQEIAMGGGGGGGGNGASASGVSSPWELRWRYQVRRAKQFEVLHGITGPGLVTEPSMMIVSPPTSSLYGKSGARMAKEMMIAEEEDNRRTGRGIVGVGAAAANGIPPTEDDDDPLRFDEEAEDPFPALRTLHRRGGEFHMGVSLLLSAGSALIVEEGLREAFSTERDLIINPPQQQQINHQEEVGRGGGELFGDHSRDAIDDIDGIAHIDPDVTVATAVDEHQRSPDGGEHYYSQYYRNSEEDGRGPYRRQPYQHSPLAPAAASPLPTRMNTVTEDNQYQDYPATSSTNPIPMLYGGGTRSASGIVIAPPPVAGFSPQKKKKSRSVAGRGILQDSTTSGGSPVRFHSTQRYHMDPPPVLSVTHQSSRSGSKSSSGGAQQPPPENLDETQRPSSSSQQQRHHHHHEGHPMTSTATTLLPTAAAPSTPYHHHHHNRSISTQSQASQVGSVGTAVGSMLGVAAGRTSTSPAQAITKVERGASVGLPTRRKHPSVESVESAPAPPKRLR